MITARVIIQERPDAFGFHVKVRDGLGRYAWMLDEHGEPIDLVDHEHPPRWPTVHAALLHFERVQDVFAAWQGPVPS